MTLASPYMIEPKRLRQGAVDAPLVGAGDVRQRIFVPATGIQQQNASILLTAQTAYFLYLMRTVAAITPKYVRAFISAAGSGAQTAEVGLFSTPSPPNAANQTLTRLVATGTVDDLTTTSATSLTLKGNTTGFATVVPAGTYLWAGIRTNLASTQPSTHRMHGEYNSGSALFVAGAGALTASTTFAGLLSGDPTLTAPWLFVTLD